ncbi:signal peptide containing protein [Theileria equi strain WA]|uniref:Signal peptide containing protein n=1 Tax=Theileria equi strain WA TaxID=1537102 RepID=L1LA65_THEEQ|nr:signal peptide containing protein [Theileria equi strain WA]EKX72332.1 signal peptide containing protein [Theileria equi strain WA]|eukprot:XP_004831784.1 signal peptide containing protein [Theileria equi strain WA]
MKAVVVFFAFFVAKFYHCGAAPAGLSLDLALPDEGNLTVKRGVHFGLDTLECTPRTGVVLGNVMEGELLVHKVARGETVLDALLFSKDEASLLLRLLVSVGGKTEFKHLKKVDGKWELLKERKDFYELLKGLEGQEVPAGDLEEGVLLDG